MSNHFIFEKAHGSEPRFLNKGDIELRYGESSHFVKILDIFSEGLLLEVGGFINSLGLDLTVYLKVWVDYFNIEFPFKVRYLSTQTHDDRDVVIIGLEQVQNPADGTSLLRMFLDAGLVRYRNVEDLEGLDKFETLEKLYSLLNAFKESSAESFAFNSRGKLESTGGTLSENQNILEYSKAEATSVSRSQHLLNNQDSSNWMAWIEIPSDSIRMRISAIYDTSEISKNRAFAKDDLGRIDSEKYHDLIKESLNIMSGRIKAWLEKNSLSSSLFEGRVPRHQRVKKSSIDNFGVPPIHIRYDWNLDLDDFFKIGLSLQVEFRSWKIIDSIKSPRQQVSAIEEYEQLEIFESNRGCQK